MKITTKSKYLKDSKTYTTVSSQATNGALKQVTNILEDSNNFKYSIDDGATYKDINATTVPDGSVTTDKLANASVTKDKISGLTANISELNFMSGVTSNVQTQLSNIRNGTTPVAYANSSANADIASTAGSAENATNATNAINLTGTIASDVTATTQANTDNSTKVANTAFVNNVLQGTTAEFTSGQLNLKVYKLYNMVFGMLTGYVKTIGITAALNGDLTEPGIDETFNFVLTTPFRPKSAFTLFTAGGNSGSTYGEFITSGLTSAGNAFYVRCINGGIIRTDGVLNFTTEGIRPGGNSSEVSHPISVCFMYETYIN